MLQTVVLLQLHQWQLKLRVVKENITDSISITQIARKCNVVCLDLHTQSNDRLALVC